MKHFAHEKVEKLFLEEWEIYKKTNEDSIQFCKIVLTMEFLKY